jgi:hypothetical protein
VAEVHVFAIPNTLYRYRSLANFERELETLQQSYIYCGDYSKLNDPMEGIFDLGSTLAETQASRSVKQAISALTADVGIGSFCEAPDNELMWAHYADQFKGICIAYNFRQLLSELPDDVYFTRMNYAERMPIVGVSRQDPEVLALRVLSYKNYRWVYEREWRMFGPKGAIHYKTAKSLRRVYLGHRVPEALRKKLEAKLRVLEVPVTAMSLDGYSIRF